MHQRKILFVLIACCWLVTSWAQLPHYPFARLDVQHGLSHNQVTSIIKDQRGFVWLGTAAGLNRFDGEGCTIFRHVPGDSTTLSNDYIVRLHLLPGNKLLITTHGQQQVYDLLTQRFTAQLAPLLRQWSLPNAVIRDVITDKAGHYYFLQEAAGVSVYNSHTQHTRLLRPQPGNATTIATSNVTSLAIGPHQFTWLLHHNGLLEMMEPVNNKIVFRSDWLFKKNKGALLAYRLFVDQEGELWVFVDSDLQGVYHFIPATQQWQQVTKGAPGRSLNNNLVTGIVQDGKGLIWISTDQGGVNLLNKKTGAVTYLLNNAYNEQSLSQNSSNVLYRDYEGVIWVGTYKKGVNYYSEQAPLFPVFRKEPDAANSLPYNDVNRFAEDARGNWWIGTNGGGLLYYDREKQTYTTYKHDPANSNSLSNDVIVSLYIDHRQQLWIGTYFGGLDCFDGKVFRHYKHNPANSNSLADDRVWEILEDAQQQLWVGTLGAGLDRFDPVQERFTHYWHSGIQGIDAHYIAALMFDDGGNRWIGTDKGIRVLNLHKQSVAVYQSNSKTTYSLSNNDVTAFLQDSRGLIWIGTREGLNYFDKSTGRFYVYDQHDGLPSGAVLNLLEDNQGRLWASLPAGLACITIKEAFYQQRPRLLVRHYRDDISGQGVSVNENAAMKTRRGELVFGGANGYTVINPEAIRNKQADSLALVSFSAGNKPVAVNRQVVLKSSENNFSVTVAALNFGNSGRAMYAYKLEGFDNNWQLANGQCFDAQYTAIPTGSYRLLVTAIPVTDTIGAGHLIVSVVVLPPFWQTGKAYGLMALAITAILMCIYFKRSLRPTNKIPVAPTEPADPAKEVMPQPPLPAITDHKVQLSTEEEQHAPVVLQEPAQIKSIQVDIHPAEIPIHSVDERFLQLVLESIERNMSNTAYTVEELSRDVHMSRVSVYKKMVALTGKSPLDFIRSIRLKRAAQLLGKSQLTIAEIAYEVGFNNPKYFAKYFKKEFNQLPSAYIKQQKGD